MTAPITITLLNTCRDKRVAGKEVDLSWDEFAKLVTAHQRRVEKDGRGFSAARFKPGPCRCGRTAKYDGTGKCTRPPCPDLDWTEGKEYFGHAINLNVDEVVVLGVDLDKMRDGTGKLVPIDEPTLVAELGKLFDRKLRLAYHSTHSYAPPAKCAARVFVALTRPVKMHEWQTFWRAAIKHLGITPGTGDVTKRADMACRFWYLPSAPDGAQVLAGTNDGAPLDVDAILANAERVPDVQHDEHDDEPRQPVEPATFEMLIAARDRLRLHGPHIKGVSPDGHARTAMLILENDWALTWSEAAPIVTEWAATCEPKWDVDRLKEIFDSCGAYAQGAYARPRELFVWQRRVQADVAAAAQPVTGISALAGIVPVDDGDEFDALYRQALIDVNAVLGTTPTIARRRRNLAEPADALRTRRLPARPWLVEQLIPAGGVLVVGGDPKAGKTWALTGIAIGVSLGAPVLGHFKTGAPKRVVYLYAEDDEIDVQARINALCAPLGNPTTPNLFVAPKGWVLDVTKPEDVAHVVATCRSFGRVDLVVLDPLRDVHSGEENSSDDMATVMRHLRVIGQLLSSPEHRCTAAVNHHKVKVSEKGDGSALRGSGAIYGALDAALMFDACNPGESELYSRVTPIVRSGKVVDTFDLTLKIEDGPNHTAVRAWWSLAKPSDGAGQAVQPTDDIITTIAAKLLVAPKHTLTSTDLRARIKMGKDRIEGGVETMRRLKLVDTAWHGRKNCGVKLTATGIEFAKLGTLPDPQQDTSSGVVDPALAGLAARYGKPEGES